MHSSRTWNYTDDPPKGVKYLIFGIIRDRVKAVYFNLESYMSRLLFPTWEPIISNHLYGQLTVQTCGGRSSPLDVDGHATPEFSQLGRLLGVNSCE